MGVIDNVRARAGAAKDWLKIPDLPSWWKRSDKSAERAAAASRVHPALIWGCFIAAIAAAVVETGFMALFVVRAVGDISWSTDMAVASGQPTHSSFAFSLTLHPLLFILLFGASAVVVWFSLFWIPSQLALRGQGAMRRFLMVAVGIFCNCLIMIGSVIVQYENRVEDIRDQVVIEQRAGQGRAALQARVDSINSDLHDLMGNDAIASPSYQMQACRAGRSAWDGYVRQAATANDPRLEQIRRAAESASRCDQLRADRQQAMQARDTAPVEAETAATVRDDAGAGLAALTAFADAWRPVGLSLAVSLIGILGNYFGFGLMQARALLTTKEEPAEPEPIISAASPEAPDISEPPPLDDLDLPMLADWRNEPDDAFEARNGMVDEEGRRQRRVAGHWRPERGAEKASPASKTDRRRAPEPRTEEPASPADEPQQTATDNAPAGDDVDELARWMRSQARPAETAPVNETEHAK